MLAKGSSLLRRRETLSKDLLAKTLLRGAETRSLLERLLTCAKKALTGTECLTIELLCQGGLLLRSARALTIEQLTKGGLLLRL